VSKSARAFPAGSISGRTALIGTGGLPARSTGRCGELGAADERPRGCTEVDQGEVPGGERAAVRLACVDAPHPDPQECGGVFAQPRRCFCVPVDEVEEVVRHYPAASSCPARPAKSGTDRSKAAQVPRVGGHREGAPRVQGQPVRRDNGEPPGEPVQRVSRVRRASSPPRPPRCPGRRKNRRSAEFRSGIDVRLQRRPHGVEPGAALTLKAGRAQRRPSMVWSLLMLSSGVAASRRRRSMTAWYLRTISGFSRY
jgi:hypothetical protein